MNAETIQRKIRDVEEKIKLMEHERNSAHTRNQSAVETARRHLDGAQNRGDDDPKKGLETQSFADEVDRYERQLTHDNESFDSRINDLRSDHERLTKEYDAALAEEEAKRKTQAAIVAASILKDSSDQ